MNIDSRSIYGISAVYLTAFLSLMTLGMLGIYLMFHAVMAMLDKIDRNGEKERMKNH